MSISFLIVDDDPNKCASILAFLKSEGIEDGSIVVSSTAAEARQALNERSFDVMLLDVLLPARSGAKPLADVSTDFLRQIVEDQTSPSPSYILGITADPAALDACQQIFQELTSQILHIDPTQDEWRRNLHLLITRIRSSIDARKSYDYDICFQTALRSPELDALLEHLPVKWGEEEQLSVGILCRKGESSIGGRTIRLACAHASQMGLVAATHLAQVLINEFRPRVLAMSGICGGIDENIQIGDVIVAEKSWDWQNGKWDSSGELRSSADQKDASADLVALARGVENEIRSYYNEYKDKKPSDVPRLHVGPIVSGSSVVADTSLHEVFKKQHRKLIAVDMECYGVYFSSAMASEPPPKVLCVKSVSDLANQRKGDDYQRFCSYLSAKVLYATLERHLA